MEHIETIELTSSQTSVTFSSVTQDYDDLVILISARSDRNTGTGTDVMLRCNSDSTSGNYSWTLLAAVPTTVFSQQDPTDYGDSAVFTGFTSQNNNTSNTFGNFTVYLANYSSTTTFKSVSSDAVSENNASNATPAISAGVYRSNSAVDTLTFFSNTATNFLSGSTFGLYGITAGGSGTVTTS